jgi:uncharacterized RDD family membrane protein YckC
VTPSTDLVVASLARRFGALLVDWILCVLLTGWFGDTITMPWLPSALLVLEYALFVGFFGQTPGMRVLGIKCGNVHDGGTIGVPRAALRGLLLVLLIPALIMDEHQRGWHDRAAGSAMLPAR